MNALPYSTAMTGHQQADSIIESGRPLNDLFSLFPTKIAAYEYFARSMSHHFSSPVACCAMCGQPCNLPPINFIWRANLHMAKTILLSFVFSVIALLAQHLYSRWVVVEFATVHRLCLKCQHHRRIRTVIVAVLHKALFAVLILLLILTVPMVVFLFAAFFVAHEGLVPLAIGLIFGLGLLGLVSWGFDVCRRAIIPKSLRQIGRSPFFLYELRKTL